MRPNRHTLDEDSASRLLQGLVHPDDAPPGYAPVAGLLASAAQLPLATVDEDAAATTVSAMAEVIRSATPVPQTSPRNSMLGKLLAGKALAAIAVVGLTATGAAAATGTLPDPVQGVVADAVSHVGVDIPHANHGKSADHRQDGEHRQDGQHGQSGEDHGQSGDDNGQSGDQNKGMSGFVQETKDNGLPVGPTVCVEASGGKCHSGDNNPGKGGGEDDSTTPSTGASGENHGRGQGRGTDDPADDDSDDSDDDEVTPPSTPTTGSIETGSDNSGREVGPSGKGKSGSDD